MTDVNPVVLGSKQLKLESIEVFAVAVPLRTPVKMAGIVIEAAENLIVKLVDSEGRTGWGEASSAPTMTGELPQAMVVAGRYLANMIQNMEFVEPKNFCKQIDSALYGNFGPKAAFEIALLDLAGQATAQPVYQLLGGAARDSADILTMIAGGDLDTEKANASRLANEGFRAFKIKVGINTPAEDLFRVEALRKHLGDDVQISADANQGYARTEAVDFAHGAKAAGLDFMEQLVDGHDLEGMAACAAVTEVPLGADEGIHSEEDIYRHSIEKAASGGSIKTIKLGGLIPTFNAGALLHSLGMSVNLAGKVAETSIASAGIMHLAMALPQLDWATSITNQYLEDDVTADPIKIVNGAVHRSDRPGLGIDIDEDKLQHYRMDFES